MFPSPAEWAGVGWGRWRKIVGWNLRAIVMAFYSLRSI